MVKSRPPPRPQIGITDRSGFSDAKGRDALFGQIQPSFTNIEPPYGAASSIGKRPSRITVGGHKRSDVIVACQSHDDFRQPSNNGQVGDRLVTDSIECWLP